MVFPVEMTEHVLITFFTSAKSNNLYCILAKLVHDISDQVKALLVCQTGNDTDHHSLRILLKSKIFLKLDLIFNFLFAEVSCVVVSCNIRICLRIEFIIINTIYNTTEAVGSGIQKAVQLLTVEWCLDLLCVGITYCSDSICKYHTSFQEVGILVCLQFIRCKIVIRKSCNILDSLNIPYTLEFQVMYCHDSLNSAEELIFLEGIMKVNRNKTCLPVVTVNDIWSEINQWKCA